MSAPTAAAALDNPNTVGAGYAAAVLAGDSEMQDLFRMSFTAEQLLDALATQMLVLGRRAARSRGISPTEVGDSLVYAARVLEFQTDITLGAS